MNGEKEAPCEKRTSKQIKNCHEKGEKRIINGNNKEEKCCNLQNGYSIFSTIQNVPNPLKTN